jgi:hypothetical protein
VGAEHPSLWRIWYESSRSTISYPSRSTIKTQAFSLIASPVDVFNTRILDGGIYSPGNTIPVMAINVTFNTDSSELRFTFANNGAVRGDLNKLAYYIPFKDALFTSMNMNR